MRPAKNTARRRPRGVLPKRLAAPEFPAELPITPRIGEIVELLRRHQAIIVAGETGSGKTTQLPKACLAAGLGVVGRIAHTQPRRLAARTVAARIAEELGVQLGAEVGYAVRFADRTSERTVVKVMTDGLLLAEIQRDPWLGRYECVIVDEAHERSLNVDFILGCLKRALQRRKDLKVVVTSATIDVDAFADYFGGAPVVQVSGRGYPVETIYAPVEDTPEAALVGCLETIAKDAPAGRRDILVFQSGEREIFENAQLLKKAFQDRFDILPLYARLPPAEQQRVFAAGTRQRVVLATNVAETSITVPNIGYVVDPGFARVSRYSYRAKLQRLPVERISRASAAQRAGRCGRVAPGVCYRLYDEEDFAARPAYTDPELRRTNLAAVVLAMRAFRLGVIEEFPFIEPPDPRAVRDAVRLLHELEALKDDELTESGRMMARLPVDPRLARMLIEGSRTGALSEVLIVVSALAAQDPRLRPLDRRDAADQVHAAFEQPGPGEPEAPKSDFVTFIRIWNWLEETRTELSRSAFRRLLEKRYLSAVRVREWRALHRQLLLACRDLGMKVNKAPADYAGLHRALLAGSLGFIGSKRDIESEGDSRDPNPGSRRRRRATEYDGARGMRFLLFPGSALRAAAPRWIVAAEISDTGSTFARCVGAVEPEWIEDAARHLSKATYSDAYWDPQRGEAMVRERVTVYGLTLVAARPRRAVEVDPATARELFALEALVGRHRQPAGKRIKADVLDRNEQLVHRVEEQQAKRRRADLLATEKTRAAFYLARLPAAVCSVAAWDRYVRERTDSELAMFVMTEADLLAGEAARFGDDDFPGRLHIGDVALPVAYKFAPGEPDDGVNVRVDLGTLSQLSQDDLDWLVPGFFAAKCEALMRALPKSLRRQLAPIPDRVDAVLPRLQRADTYRQGNLYGALSEAVRATIGVLIPIGDWRPTAVPDHLRINIQVRGQRKRLVDQDRDLAALQGRLLAEIERTITRDVGRDRERHGIKEFPAEGVPDRIAVGSGAGRALVYPVLVDRGDSVDLLMHAMPSRQAVLNRGGYARLALLVESSTARYLRREVERDASLGLRYAPVGPLTELVDGVLLAVAWYACFENRELPNTRAMFENRLTEAKASWLPTFQRVLGYVRDVFQKRFELARRIDALSPSALSATQRDLACQLDEIAGGRILATLPSDRLADIPRYLDGMLMRIDSLHGRVERDLAGIAAVAAWERRLHNLREAGVDTGDLAFFVQEFRIATFSQRLGTKGKVSAKRLETQFATAEATVRIALNNR